MGAPTTRPKGITPQNTIYLVLLLTAAILSLKIRFKRLSRGQIGKFREFVEQLYWDESYGELFTVLQNNLHELFEIARSEPVGSRLRRRFGHNPHVLTADELRELIDATSTLEVSSQKVSVRRPVPAPSRFRSVTHRVARQFVRFLPDNNQAQQTAQEVVHALLLSPRLVKALVRTRPYLGLEIICLWTYSRVLS